MEIDHLNGGTMHRTDIIAEYIGRMIRDTGYSPVYAAETACTTVYRRPTVHVTYKVSTLSTPRRAHKARVRLTHDARNVIAWVRNSVARERVAIADAREARYAARTAKAQARADAENAAIIGWQAVTEQWDPSTWKGLTTSREARYAERGRGTASKVSVRDAHVQPLLLRGLKTVGVATHPDASDADYVLMVNTVRANPSWATLTRRMPGPHGYSDLLTTVVPVSEYTEKDTDAQARGTRHVRQVEAPRESDSVRLASVIGYVGNVE